MTDELAELREAVARLTAERDDLTRTNDGLEMECRRLEDDREYNAGLVIERDARLAALVGALKERDAEIVQLKERRREHEKAYRRQQEGVELSWSDRGGGLSLPEEFADMVYCCALDHSYDRTADGVPDGMPIAYRTVFVPIVERHLSLVEPDWRNKTVYGMSDEQEAAFKAELEEAAAGIYRASSDQAATEPTP